MSAWEADGQSDEWLTPEYIFDALDCSFDLDVAAPASRETYVPARDRITADSLARDWRGFVWMNPPFGKRNGLEPWLDKFFVHGDGIALVPDRTSAPWFQAAAKRADALLFLAPKVKFERLDGTLGRSPGCGTVLVAKGARGVKALTNGRSLGFLALGYLNGPL